MYPIPQARQLENMSGFKQVTTFSYLLLKTFIQVVCGYINKKTKH